VALGALQVLALQVGNHHLRHHHLLQQRDLKLSSVAHSVWAEQSEGWALTRLSVLFLLLAWIELVSEFGLAQLL
jgi:hypothetical protein